ncbi:hypothetical protein BC938DRAFT_474162, partial [Jimgerdemannia flammicorona]
EKTAEIEKYKSVGVEVVAAEYTDPAGLVKALKGVDVVVSTVGTAVIETQISLIKAAEEAGVKRFIPSEFGSDISKIPSPVFNHKRQISEYLRTTTLEYTIFYTNYWLDTILFFAEWDLTAGKAIIIGDGNDRFTVTHRKDVAKFVVASLSNPKSRNAVHGTASAVVTWRELLSLAEKHSGKKFDVTYKDLGSVQAELAATKDFTHEYVRDTVLSIAAQGLGLVEESVAVDYPEIKVITPDQFFREFYNKA